MWWSKSVWLAWTVMLACLIKPQAAQAQAEFPPAAVKAAQSLQAAFGVLGAGRPDLSTHLLLDVPDIVAPGKVQARVRSALPGTSLLVVFRGIPTPPGPPPAPLARPSQPAQAARGQAPAAPPAPTLLLAATRVEPGDPPSFEFDFYITQRETLTFIAFAQGRWHAAVREIKVATLAEQAR